MSSYEISKSSLLSLKAEILRKQQELVKAKADNEVKIKVIKKNTPLEIKNKGIEQRLQNDIVEEDEDLLKQSRSVLEAKSKLYEKLSSGNITEEQRELKKRFLVRFDKKKSSVPDLPPPDSEDSPDKYPESDEDFYQSDNEIEKDPGEKWVDYVDCLGRTRKCLQKDLEHLKEKDEDLKKTVDAKKKNEEVNEKLESFEKIEKNSEEVTEESHKDYEQNKLTDESELLSNDMRREMLRRQWEQEEDELRNKSNIHYQDILFGEARTHGVGYYGFSKDEEERAKQQEGLKKLRIETEQKQKRAQELKAMRERQLAARIKAAKDRKRARLGLPPEEEIAEIPVEPEISEEERKKQEELKEKEAEKEKILEDARKRHIRPWDIGKEGVKEHYEMTQEEWIDKKREERPKEFAPPNLYRTEFRSIIKDIEIEDTDKTLNFTTKKSKKKQRKRANVNPYKASSLGPQNINNVEEVNKNDNTVEDFTTDYYQEIDRSAGFETTPIVNLCEETDFDDRLLSEYRKTMQNVSDHLSDNSVSDDDGIKRRGVEIAPPPTFDYYGPSYSKKPRSTSVVSNIEDSIEAGLKFLRTQVEKKEKSSKRDGDMYLS